MPSAAGRRVAASNRALPPGLDGRPVAAPGEGLGVGAGLLVLHAPWLKGRGVLQPPME